LANINKLINQGVSIESLRDDLARSEKSLAFKEERLEALKSALALNEKLCGAVQRWFFTEKGKYSADRALVEEHGLDYTDFVRLNRDITANKSQIEYMTGIITEERDKLAETSKTLTAFERIASMTYAQNLVDVEHNRRLSEQVGSGLKSVDVSMEESMRIDVVVDKVVEAVEQQSVYKPKRK
jgi:hypothetical protein